MAHTPAHYPNLVKKYARPLPRVYTIFLFAIEYSAKAQHTTTGARALAEYSMANRKIAYTLGRGWAYVSDMSSTSGYMSTKYFQEFDPNSFDMSSASGYMGAKYFQEFSPHVFDMSLESPRTGPGALP